MNNIYILLISILSAVVGFFVFLKGRDKQPNQSFFIVALSAAIWLLCLYLLSNTGDKPVVLFLARLAYAAGMLAPAGLLHFVYCYPNFSISYKQETMIYLPGLLVVALSFTPLVVSDCQIHAWGVKAMTGPGIIAVIVYFIIYLILITIKITKEYIAASVIQRKQWIFIVLGLPVPILHILITNIILPRIWFEQAYKLGPLAALEIVGLLGFAIYKYHLFDIKIIAKRAVYYSMMTISISSIYFFSIIMIHQFLGQDTSHIVAILISSFFIAITIRPLYKVIDHWTDKLFYRKKHDYINYFEKVYDDISYVEKLPQTLHELIVPIVEVVRFSQAGIYLKDSKIAHHYSLVTHYGHNKNILPEAIADDNILIAYMQRNKAFIDTEEKRYYNGHITDDEHEETRLLHMLDNELNAKQVIPLKSKAHLLGFILLGIKKNEEPVNAYEKTFLKTFSREIANLVENNMLYNETLKNERLALVGTMSSSFAHEIRNPLAAINSYIDLLKDRVGDQKFIQQFYRIVPGEIERITTLTEDLLNFAKADKQIIECICLNDLVRRAIELMENKLRKKGIEFEFKEIRSYTIQADRQQIYQTILNIILNAYHAVEQCGKIDISLDDHDQYVRVMIKDNGKGINEKDLNRIFEPFFSTKIYGTGLGLTTCKRIIEAHNGFIEVESEVAKGCRFDVYLPMLNPDGEKT